MLPQVIGLLGRARRGKDTVADYICKKYPDYRKVKLAAPVKDAARCLYGFSHDQLEGAAKEIVDPRWNISPRDAMVFITDTFMDKMGSTFFTRRLFDAFDANTCPHSGAHIIISDVRYVNDIAEIRKRNGIVIKITRATAPYHPWERSIDSLAADYTITNDGSLEQLYRNIDAIMRCTAARSV